jgi:hypothetical protein
MIKARRKIGNLHLPLMLGQRATKNAPCACRKAHFLVHPHAGFDQLSPRFTY